MILNNKIYALDLGTTKFCLATLAKDTTTDSPSAQFITVPASGMRRGMLVNFQQAQQSLNILIESAEIKLKKEINRIVVGIAGTHLTSDIVKTSYTSSEFATVNQSIIKKLENLAKRKSTLSNKEILHIIPIKYRIDERDPIKNPIGFSFNSIEVEYFVIHADKLYLSDVVKLCNSCGLEVTRLYAEPYASASVILKEQAKEAGVAIADIGGGTTDGIIFVDGAPRKIFTVNVGGKLITNDLSIGLGVPTCEAEKIKTTTGTGIEEKQVLCTKDIYNNAKNINYEAIYNILNPRIYELTNLIQTEIQKEKIFLSGGLVLTGGGSETINLVEHMKNILPYSVQKTRPSLPNKLCQSLDLKNSSALFSTQLATVLGLLYLENVYQAKKRIPSKTSLIHKYFKELAVWLKELS